MRILILASTFPRWEKDTLPSFVLDFAQTIAKNHNVVVLAPHEKGSKLHELIGDVEVYRFMYTIPGFEKLAYRGGMVNAFRSSILAKLQLPYFLLSQLLWASWIIGSRNISLINAHWLFPQGWIAMWLRIMFGMRVVVTTHGGDVAILNKGGIAKLLKPAITNSDAVTFVSSIAAENAKSALKLKKTDNFHIMPMGINLPEVHAAKKSEQANETLFIGRLVTIKGLDVLLKAFAEIKAHHPKMTLRVLGDGPQREEWEQLAKSLQISDSVRFEGYITGDRKDEFLRNCDIMVVPSIRDANGYEEGLPVSALEAMAYGKILIASKTGSLPALVNGRNGILFESGSSEQIVAAVDKVLGDKNLREKMISEARATASQYTWSSIGERFDEVVSKV